MTEVDHLVPDPQVRKEFNVSAMTFHRWSRDPKMQFPPAVKINRRNYRSRLALENFKAKLVAEALRRR
jgi:hypothetical protein